MRKTILYVQYADPRRYPQFERSARILAFRGWRLIGLGVSAAPGAARSYELHPAIRVRLLRFCSPGWRQKLHYAFFCLFVFCQTIRHRPEVMYVSDMFACLPALLARTCWRARLLYHEQDYPCERFPQSGFERLMFWARYWVSRHAVACVIPNEQRARLFIERVNVSARIHVVPNCPLRAETVASSRVNGQNIWFYYHCSVVPPRLPPAVIEALRVVPDAVKMMIVGYETVGYPEYIKQLRTLVCSYGLQDRVAFVGPCAHDDALRYCGSCDVGLALMPKTSDDINLRYMVGASVKLFEYLACGLALLVTDLPDWRAAYVAAGYGLACDPDDSKSIARAFMWCHQNREAVRAMGELGRRKIQDDWNYETQFSPVVTALEQ